MLTNLRHERYQLHPIYCRYIKISRSNGFMKIWAHKSMDHTSGWDRAMLYVNVDVITGAEEHLEESFCWWQLWSILWFCASVCLSYEWYPTAAYFSNLVQSFCYTLCLKVWRVSLMAQRIRLLCLYWTESHSVSKLNGWTSGKCFNHPLCLSIILFAPACI